jgi:hypothetical protein
MTWLTHLRRSLPRLTRRRRIRLAAWHAWVRAAADERAVDERVGAAEDAWGGEPAAAEYWECADAGDAAGALRVFMRVFFVWKRG